MPDYPAGSSVKPTWVYIDPDDCMPLQISFAGDLSATGDTIATYLIEAPAGVNLGDGLTTFAGKAGTLTPAAPSLVNGSLEVEFWIYGCAIGVHAVEVSINSGQGRALSRTGVLRVSDR